MNFFEHQDRARTQTKLLVFYYVVAVAMIVVAVNVVVYYTFCAFFVCNKTPFDHVPLTTILTLAVIATGMISGHYAMNKGGHAVAEILGARKISPSTSNLAEQQLLNVVQEMALASGVITPGVYVFDDPAINAFAAGTKPNSAVIAVSLGALTHLTRDELQGVVAHEFSHIFNGDMSLNVKLLGVLRGILLIAMIGRVLTRSGSRAGSRSRSGSSNNAGPLLGLALIAIGYIGVLMSRLIKSAVSRQREFLADASAVQFTRNPAGITGALRKIQSNSSALSHERSEELSHFFFAQGFKSAVHSLFATHPPLEQRIRAIDPSNQWVTKAQKPESIDSDKTPPKPQQQFNEKKTVSAAAITAAAVVAAVATPTAQDLEAAIAYQASLPHELKQYLASADKAPLVIFALIHTGSEAVLKKQTDIMAAVYGPGVIGAVQHIKTLLEQTPLTARLPLVDMALPWVREKPEADQKQFMQAIGDMIQADNRVHPFEFALNVLLETVLIKQEAQAGEAPSTSDMLCLLSYIAYAGAGLHEQKAAQAFKAGYEKLQRSETKAIMAWHECTDAAARESLKRLSRAAPAQKEKLVAALSTCITADGTISADEWDMLRTFCECLNCPVPLLPPR